MLAAAGAAGVVAAVAAHTDPAMAADAVEAAADAATQTEESDWFTPLVEFNAGVIDGIDSVIEDNLKIPNSFGVAIIAYTVLIKILTYPLNQSSLRTGAMMQLVQPKVKQIQTKYKNDQETMNRMMLRLYDDIGVNPLGGCFPALLQLPIYIGLYRSIGKLAASNDRFREPFLWIPSLAGPVEANKPSLDWLIKSQSPDEFIPLIGWNDAGLYLILPAMLIVSQYVTTQASAPQQQQAQGPLGFVTGLFPLIIGYTALVSPAGLGVYWLCNNLLTQAQTYVIRSELGEEFPQYKKILDGTAAKEEEERKKMKELEALDEEEEGIPTGLGKGFGAGAVDDDDDDEDELEAVGSVKTTTSALDAQARADRRAKRLAKRRRRR